MASLRAMPTPFFFCVWLCMGPRVRMGLAPISFELEDYIKYNTNNNMIFYSILAPASFPLTARTIDIIFNKITTEIIMIL